MVIEKKVVFEKATSTTQGKEKGFYYKWNCKSKKDAVDDMGVSGDDLHVRLYRYPPICSQDYLSAFIKVFDDKSSRNIYNPEEYNANYEPRIPNTFEACEIKFVRKLKLLKL